MTYLCFFFNDTAATEIYTLSLHDALPISTEFANAFTYGGATVTQYPLSIFPREVLVGLTFVIPVAFVNWYPCLYLLGRDRKSTRLNSSHANISYAVFCLKKKKHINTITRS